MDRQRLRKFFRRFYQRASRSSNALNRNVRFSAFGAREISPMALVLFPTPLKIVRRLLLLLLLHREIKIACYKYALLESARYRSRDIRRAIAARLFAPRSFDARDVCSLLSSFFPNCANERSLGYITLVVTRCEPERVHFLPAGRYKRARDKRAQTHERKRRQKWKRLQLNELKCRGTLLSPAECADYRRARMKSRRRGRSVSSSSGDESSPNAL